jgi:hypothetical protein
VEQYTWCVYTLCTWIHRSDLGVSNIVPLLCTRTLRIWGQEFDHSLMVNLGLTVSVNSCCDWNVNKLRMYLTVFTVVDVCCAHRMQSSCFSWFSSQMSYTLNTHLSDTSTSLHNNKNIFIHYQKKANNRRKRCNPAALFLVVVEHWTALATKPAERLSLVKLSLSQKHMVLCLSFRYKCGFSFIWHLFNSNKVTVYIYAYTY